MSRIIVVMWLVSHVPFRVAFSGVCKWRFSYLCLFLLTAGQVLMAVSSEAWPAIAPEEMSLKDDPLKPGAPAIILHKEIFSNHHNSYHRYHYRIKIFTDEGKDYANIEIPYFADAIRVTDLRARTVRPDGKELPFQGEVFEKPVAKMGKTKFLAKTFTLPSVEVGSIVEYQYTLRSDILLTPPWPIEEELSIRRARFSLKPSVGFSGFNHKLDPSSIVEQADGTYLVELENIPALQDEVFMPPESQFKSFVYFVYLPGGPLGVKPESNDDFWKRMVETSRKRVEKFIGKRKGIRRAVSKMISPEDSPRTKLHKIYTRVQAIRNLSFERSRTKEERKREKLKKNKNVEDVLKRGYGYGNEINQLFVALARAAGFDSAMVLLSDRSEFFFDDQLRNRSQLGFLAVSVRVGSEELHLEPGTACTPFGLLPWRVTGVRGVRLDEHIKQPILKRHGKGDGFFLRTQQPASADALTKRRAKLRLGEDGSLRGEMELVFDGHEAMERRLAGMETDEVGRREQLREEMKELLPVGAEIEIEETLG